LGLQEKCGGTKEVKKSNPPGEKEEKLHVCLKLQEKEKARGTIVTKRAKGWANLVEGGHQSFA